jgi:hypothetical protein
MVDEHFVVPRKNPKEENLENLIAFIFAVCSYFPYYNILRSPHVWICQIINKILKLLHLLYFILIP